MRYSTIFRDTMPLSRMTALSFVLPGFSQLHNKQAWKIPILYATVGTTMYFGIIQHRNYVTCRGHYDGLIRAGRVYERDVVDPVQKSMIKYNTRRQLLFGGMILSYIYFIGDGVMNHPGASSGVKKATTLSTIFPGAGQIYNGSYWKAPIVMGAFASMAYMVDWNNRGYKRFKLAYELRMDGDDNTHDEFHNNPNTTAEDLRKYKDNYRRNRDLCIILTGACYLLNLVDAHVEAHMKDYDISDDLSVSLEPAVTNLYTMRSGFTNQVGFSLKITF